MVVETKEIGINIGINKGNYVNTEFKNDYIQLKQVSVQEDGSPVYEKEGYWESEVVDLIGKFKEYDKIAVSVVKHTSDTYAILTRVSDDGIEFTEYVVTTTDGKMQSKTARYVQVKINLFAGAIGGEISLYDPLYSIGNDIIDWDNSEYLEVRDSIKLKTDYNFTMNKDETWSETGTLHRSEINPSEWRKINSIQVWS